MRMLLAGFAIALAVAGMMLHQASCGTDTCRIDVDSPSDGDPIPVTVCATCNKGKDPQGAETIALEFIPNGVDVGCRCAGATCVFCVEDCTDPQCTVTVQTNEADGCTAPAISLELDDEDFETGERVPVTINASSRFGSSTRVVHLSNATPTPTSTPEPTSTPTPEPTSGGIIPGL